MSNPIQLAKDHNLPGYLRVGVIMPRGISGAYFNVYPEVRRSGIVGYSESREVGSIGTTGRMYKVVVTITPLEDGEPIRVTDEEA